MGSLECVDTATLNNDKKKTVMLVMCKATFPLGANRFNLNLTRIPQLGLKSPITN